MEREKLIEEVREFQCLWMVSARGYRDQWAKENAWKKIASDVSTRPFPIMLIFHTPWQDNKKKLEML